MAATTTEKHPRGLYVLFGTEMWERYSFYTVGAMLSLYLRDTTDGFSFSNARSASVVSTYNMFIYFTPLIGGLIADRLTGFRKAIMIGGVSFMIGHALLAVPDNLFICYLALTFLVIGNGFFKPNVSSMVGNLYREGSHLKDKAYLIFYMGINIGALLAPLIAGFVQPRWGFHPAFFMGAIGSSRARVARRATSPAMTARAAISRPWPRPRICRRWRRKRWRWRRCRSGSGSWP
jgi:proton-dependent oligopeptide transporter, POT family